MGPGRQAGTRPGAAQMLGRALRLRCPSCGTGRVLLSWLRLRSRCPECNLRLDRGESDYFVGAYLINLVVAELIVVAGMLVVMFATWPDVPWEALTWALACAMVPAPFVTFPFSRTLWLAIDLVFRPASIEDFTPDP
jgi:uncharacterized protein (DUF983 family)